MEREWVLEFENGEMEKRRGRDEEKGKNENHLKYLHLLNDETLWPRAKKHYKRIWRGEDEEEEDQFRQHSFEMFHFKTNLAFQMLIFSPSNIMLVKIS